MQINSFSSLIELAASISIAFVAVEYVKSYTAILCERFFRFQDFITTSFDDCRKLLTDYETLHHIGALDVSGNSVNEIVESAKRKHESLNKEIKETENQKKNEMIIACQAKSMSSLCFFLFLQNVLLLFIGVFEVDQTEITHSFILIFCILCLLYLLLGWFLGESDKSIKFFNFSSLRHPVRGFLLIVLLSAILALIVHFWFRDGFYIFASNYWWYFVTLNVVLSYFNFVVFVMKINKKATKFKESVISQKKELLEKCAQCRQETNDILGVARINSKLTACYQQDNAAQAGLYVITSNNPDGGSKRPHNQKNRRRISNKRK